MATETSEHTTYAIILCGGKQYRVEAGSWLTVDRVAGERGAQVVFDRVLFLRDGAEVQIGQPMVEGTRVLATIVEQRRDKKIRIFKYRRRKKSRRTMGHRQNITRLRIEAIERVGSGDAPSAPPPFAG